MATRWSVVAVILAMTSAAGGDPCDDAGQVEQGAVITSSGELRFCLGTKCYALAPKAKRLTRIDTVDPSAGAPFEYRDPSPSSEVTSKDPTRVEVCRGKTCKTFQLPKLVQNGYEASVLQAAPFPSGKAVVIVRGMTMDHGTAEVYAWDSGKQLGTTALECAAFRGFAGNLAVLGGHCPAIDTPRQLLHDDGTHEALAGKTYRYEPFFPLDGDRWAFEDDTLHRLHIYNGKTGEHVDGIALPYRTHAAFANGTLYALDYLTGAVTLYDGAKLAVTAHIDAPACK